MVNIIYLKTQKLKIIGLYGSRGDFLVDEKYTFVFTSLRNSVSLHEVGGKNKSFKQIKDIEIGFGTKVPLWLFGFLY